MAPGHDASPGGRIALYRFYDASEALLYVGISNEPWCRRKEHSVTQSWWPKVRHQAITWYDSEDEARAAETRAIRAERPEFNKAGAVRPARARYVIRPLWVVNAAGVLWIGTMGVIAVMVVVQHPSDLLRTVMAPVALTVSLGSLLATLVALVIIAAPWIARFGAWLDRNSVWPERTVVKFAQRQA